MLPRFGAFVLVGLVACAAPGIGGSEDQDGEPNRLASDSPMGDTSTLQPGNETNEPDLMLRAAVGGDSIGVRWSERGSPGVVEHRIYRDGKQVGSVTPGYHPEFPELYGNGFLDTDVTPGKTYEYRVQAIYKDGKAADQSAPIRVTHPQNPVAAPKIITDASAAPDLKDWLDNTARRFLTIWYPKIVQMVARPDYAPATTLKFHFGPANGVMATNAADASCEINPEWTRKALESGEALGALLHEVTHTIQNYKGSVPGWIVEGLADYSRDVILHDRDISQLWPGKDFDGRGQFVLNWMQTKYGKDGKSVPHAINVSAHNGYNEDVFQQATGKTLRQLTAELNADVRPYGVVRIAGERCLDGSLTNNRAQFLPCKAEASTQGWTVTYSPYGYLFLVGENDACIDVKHSGNTPGAVVWSYGCHQGGSQKWELNADRKLFNREAGLCLAVGTDTSSIELQECTNSAAVSVLLPGPS